MADFWPTEQQQKEELMATNPFYQQYAQQAENIGQQIAELSEAQRAEIKKAGGASEWSAQQAGLTPQQVPIGGVPDQYMKNLPGDLSGKQEEYLRMMQEMARPPKEYHWGARPDTAYRLW